MPELLTLVESLIAEHKTLKEKFGTLENAMNDARLIKDISHAADSLSPGTSRSGCGLI